MDIAAVPGAEAGAVDESFADAANDGPWAA
jgi:hypothetical protein